MKSPSLFAFAAPKRTALSIVLAGLAGLPTFISAAAAAEPGFVSLFDGTSLAGWDGNTKLWAVKEGAIVGQTTAENPTKGNTFLIWKGGKVADFELRLSYKITGDNPNKEANSGIQYRSQDHGNWVVGGYQADFEAGKTYSGINYEERGRGIIAQRGQVTLIKADASDSSKPKIEVIGSLGASADIQGVIKAEDWNDYIIFARGNQLTHIINGRVTSLVIDEHEARAAKEGILALQLHAGPPMTVQFKDLRIRHLGSGASVASKPDSEMVHGSWIATKVIMDGNDLGSGQSEPLITKITRDRFESSWSGGSDRGVVKFLKDAPGQIDMTSELAGETRGIYQVNGDEFKVCYALEGGPRPSKFSSEPESKHLFIVYKRNKF